MKALPVRWFLASIAFCVTYMAIKVFTLPVPIYLPAARSCVWVAPPGSLPMKYYSFVSYAIAAFLVAWGIGAIPAVEKALAGRTARRTLIAVTAVVYLCSFGFELKHELSLWAAKRPGAETPTVRWSHEFGSADETTRRTWVRSFFKRFAK